MGSEVLLDQIYAALTQFGYTVWMSHKGTAPIDSRLNAFENCLCAVETCDIFLGIITPSYGSGRVGQEPSITHQEILRAIELGKLRWFLAHHHVVLARQILKQFRFDEKGQPRAEFSFKRTGVIDHIGVVEMYEAAIRADIADVAQRTGNWVQSYVNTDEVLKFIEDQLGDLESIKELLKEQT